MRHRRLLAVLLAALLGGSLRASAQDEDGLARLWLQHLAASNDHAAAATACGAFADSHAHDLFAGIGRHLQAWHLLKQGQTGEAVRLLGPLAREGTNALEEATSHQARAWLTRVDREQVRAALQFFYRKEIRYPYSLTELLGDARLPAALHPPEKDRWNQSWRYRLVPFKTMPNLKDQKYELLAGELGADSDLAKALALAYAERLRWHPVRVRSTAVAGREVVELAPLEPGATRPAAGAAAKQFTVGVPADGVRLAYVGPRLVILCDHLHWRIVPRPPGP